MLALVKIARIIIFAMFITCSACADHELDIYSFDSLFVFDTFTNDLQSRRMFNVVILSDTAKLKIAGQVKTQVDSNVSAYSNYKNYLIVLLWNQVEIYDLRNPTNPTLVKSFSLQEHESWPGDGRIIKWGNKFILLSTNATAELIMDNDITKWKINNIKRTKELHEKTLIKLHFPSFNNGLRNPSPFVVKETEKFRYEIYWEKEDRGKYIWAHKKYLRKVRRKDERVVSNLLLGEIMETGGGE